MDHVRHLYRSEENRVIAGICAGLGEYWHIDPVALRFAWIVGTLVTGVIPGVIAYVLGVIIIPVQHA